MANYFRITVYHPVEDFSAIIDSCGMFDKLWQFSSYMVHLLVLILNHIRIYAKILNKLGVL